MATWRPLLVLAAALLALQMSLQSLVAHAAPPAVQALPAAGANHSPQAQFSATKNLNTHFQSGLSPATANPYTTATNMLLLDLRQQMITRALRFDEHFRSLLSQSKLSLHNTFVDTYGMMYERNMEIFTSMYESLEQYYATGQIKLTEAMENFFEHLYQKIFQVYNSNRAFPPSYLECATLQLANLKPFKDVPDELTKSIKHAFVAARTFNQVLNSGIDVIKGIISLGQPTQCLNLINEKLLKREGPGARLAPCMPYCEQVMIRCVGRLNLEQLSDKWKLYVMSLGELAKKLSVHYNLETSIGPLGQQISEAIMNFQDNAQNITNQVGHYCGSLAGEREAAAESVSGGLRHIKPVPNRLGKRAASVAAAMEPAVGLAMPPARRQQQQHLAAEGANEFTFSQSHQQASNSYNTQHQPGTNNVARAIQQHAGQNHLGPRQPQPQPTPSAQRPHQQQAGAGHDPMEPAGYLQPIANRSPVLIGEIKDFMLSTRAFWSNLPMAVCTSNQTLGHTSAAYSPYSSSSLVGSRRQQQAAPVGPASGAVGQCFREDFGLSDMNTDLRFRTEIQQLGARLELMISRIQDALNGNEIDWSASPVELHQQQQAPRQQPGRPTFASSPPSTSSTTTTTTPYPAEPLDDDNTEDLEAIEDSGSGSAEIADGGEADDELESAHSTTELDDLEDDYPTTTGSSSADSEDGTDNGARNGLDEAPRPGHEQNSLQDQKPDINPELESNGLITPPDQSPQKSSGSPPNLVITNPSQLLLVLLLSVALSIVNHPTRRPRVGQNH